MLSSLNYDVLIFCETWLTISVQNSLLLNNIDYLVHGIDRPNRIGGGVCVFYRNFIKMGFVSTNFISDEIQLLCFDLLGSPLNYRLIVCYVPPSFNNDVLNEFIGLFEIGGILKLNSTSIICGDFNIPSNNKLSGFLDVMIEHGFTQYVNSPTRGDHFLDLVFVNDDFAVNDVNVGPPFSTSDHNSITFNLVYLRPAPHSSAHSRYKFTLENLKLICDDLELVNWSDMFRIDGLECVWNLFRGTILSAADKFATIVTSSSPAHCKSYPKHIKKLLSRKTMLWKAWHVNKTLVLQNQYKDCARECRLAIHKYYSDIEVNVIRSNKIGNFYKYANRKLSCKSGIGAIKDASGKLISDPFTRANYFYDFFGSVFTVDNGIMPPIKQRSPDNVSISNIKFTNSGVLKILKRLNVKSAGGPDLLPPILLKNIAPSIASPMASMFELFYINSFLPSIWKLSHVKPIFKKGDSSLVSNYRPISLTCTSCKVMENIIHNQLLSYLHSHKLISDKQHGFLARRSTGTNLLSYFHD